jgi:hypothetical protein
MLRTDAPRPAPRRLRSVSQPLVSLRSPLPLLVAGIGVTILVIALVTLPPRAPAPDPTQTETLSHQEVLTLVATQMRSGDAANQVMSQGDVRFEDGTWTITVGQAQFHFSQRNRIVVPDNPPAAQLEFREPAARTP